MNYDNQQDPLDSLLAQPALIADRGFARQIETKVKNASKLRRRVFGSFAVLWLLIAVAVVSPGALLTGLQELVSMLTYQEILQALTASLNSTELTAITITPITAGLIVVACAAIASLLVRK